MMMRKYLGKNKNTITMPTRIQRSRAAGSKQPANTHYCGRPGKWGNLFVVHQITHTPDYFRVSVNTPNDLIRDICIYILTASGPAGFFDKGEAKKHAVNLFGKLIDEIPNAYPVQELAAYDHLSCWCSLDETCHVDEILRRL